MASGLKVVYTGTGGTLRDVVVTSNPPGFDPPYVEVIGGNTIRFTWPQACVDQGEMLEYEFSVDYPCETVQLYSVEWTHHLVPTLTQWGLIVLVLLLIASAIFIMLTRRKATLQAQALPEAKEIRFPYQAIKSPFRKVRRGLRLARNYGEHISHSEKSPVRGTTK